MLDIPLATVLTLSLLLFIQAARHVGCCNERILRITALVVLTLSVFVGDFIFYLYDFFSEERDVLVASIGRHGWILIVLAIMLAAGEQKCTAFLYSILVVSLATINALTIFFEQVTIYDRIEISTGYFELVWGVVFLLSMVISLSLSSILLHKTYKFLPLLIFPYIFLLTYNFEKNVTINYDSVLSLLAVAIFQPMVVGFAVYLVGGSLGVYGRLGFRLRTLLAVAIPLHYHFILNPALSLTFTS